MIFDIIVMNKLYNSDSDNNDDEIINSDNEIINSDDAIIIGNGNDPDNDHESNTIICKHKRNNINDFDKHNYCTEKIPELNNTGIDTDTDTMTNLQEITEPDGKKKDPILQTNKSKYYYVLLKKYYKTCSIEQISQLISIISGESRISLRNLDWFVTKYSKQNMILINSDNYDEINISNYTNVHISYKAQLKSHTKQYFDPFKRKLLINFKFANIAQPITTSISQLNFFKWLFENKILNYVYENHDFLNQKMRESNMNGEKIKIDKKNKKIVKQQKNIPINMNNIISKPNCITLIFE